MLLDHEQLLLPQHLLLGEELELGGVLQRASRRVHPGPHGASTLNYVTTFKRIGEKKQSEEMLTSCFIHRHIQTAQALP